MSKEKYIGNAQLTKKPSTKLNLLIAPGAVTTEKIAAKAITYEKLGEEVPTRIIELVKPITAEMLSDALGEIWEKLEAVTGEVLHGIDMQVTPGFFISEGDCNVNITANTVEAGGSFEHIAFYINGILLAEDDDIDTFSCDTTISDTSVVKCVATIKGIDYVRQYTITHYNSFWLGAGTNYEDIMDEGHVIPITEGMRGAHDITCNNGDNIIIVLGTGIRGSFLRADINGFEIPFTETEVEIEGSLYRVFVSKNTYDAGTYNIDING